MTIEIWNSVAGSPGGNQPLATFPIGNRVDRSVFAGLQESGLTLYTFNAEVDFSAAGGQTYWLSIYNDTQLRSGHYFWGSYFSPTGNAHSTSDQGGSWESVAVNHNNGSQRFAELDFRLTAVPEPNASILLALLSFQMMRRTRRP